MFSISPPPPIYNSYYINSLYKFLWSGSLYRNISVMSVLQLLTAGCHKTRIFQVSSQCNVQVSQNHFSLSSSTYCHNFMKRNTKIFNTWQVSKHNLKKNIEEDEKERFNATNMLVTYFDGHLKRQIKLVINVSFTKQKR